MNQLKEVYYNKWCPKCQFQTRKENEEPCWECLTEFVAEDTHKPVMFKERGTNNENRRRRVRNSNQKGCS